MRSRCRKILFLLLLSGMALPTDAVAAQDEWVEVRSEHFAVVSDADEERARRIAGLLETIRQVFVNAFPGVPPREGPPLEVFAAKDRDTLRELLPGFAETDPRNMPPGLYVPTPDRNFIVLLEGVRTENPYETVFHEYFHSLASPAAPWAPRWFHEGIAEFWENTLIKSDTVETGRPSETSLQILRNERWMPLEELVGADYAFTNSLSPRRTSVFYAQSWLIFHYMFLGDQTDQLRNGITPYLQYMMSGQSSIEAFEAAFGGLEDLERQLRQYLQRYRYRALEIEKPRNIDADAYPAAVLPPDQLNARLGSYFVHRRLDEEGRAALDRALELNPDEALAHEALGVLQYRTGDLVAAKLSFEKAASLNGTLFLPHYYLSFLETSEPGAAGSQRIQARLERAVRMNPYHAPSLARLSFMYVHDAERRELALTLARRAAGLSPTWPYAYVAQGVAAKANGMIIEARFALETAQRLAPGYEVAQTELEEVKRIQQYPMSGMWGFDGNREWLQIDIDGSALRCVWTRSGPVRYTGKLTGSEVTWTIPDAEGSVTESTETLAVAGAELRLETDQGELVLQRVRALPAACEPIFDLPPNHTPASISSRSHR